MAEECHTSAVKAVLALPELLEHIIYLMPARTILTKASRVSRKWSQTINTSPRIRRLLFLPTETTSAVSPRTFQGSTSFVGTYSAPIYGETLAPNPLVQRPTERCQLPLFERSQRYRDDPNSLRMILLFHDTEMNYLKTAKIRQHSLRKMFLTDPPCTTMLVKCVTRAEVNDGQGRRKKHVDFGMNIRDPGGITIGLVADVLMNAFSPPLLPNWVASKGHFTGFIFDAASNSEAFENH